MGCLSAAPQSCSTSRRYPHSRLPIAAAAVHPWPWRSMSTDSTPSLKQGVKLSSRPIASHFGQPAKQAETESLWHAVDLQEDSSSYVPSAVESTEAAADAFKVKSAEQLQVYQHRHTYSCKGAAMCLHTPAVTARCDNALMSAKQDSNYTPVQCSSQLQHLSPEAAGNHLLCLMRRGIVLLPV